MMIQRLEVQAFSQCRPFEHNFQPLLTNMLALPQYQHGQVCMILYLKMGGRIIRTGKEVSKLLRHRSEIDAVLIAFRV
jgi:hypothetical protein